MFLSQAHKWLWGELAMGVGQKMVISEFRADWLHCTLFYKCCMWSFLGSSKVPSKISLYKSQSNVARQIRASNWQFCLRKPVFALVSSALLVLYATTFLLGAVGFLLYLHQRKMSREADSHSDKCSQWWTMTLTETDWNPDCQGTTKNCLALSSWDWFRSHAKSKHSSHSTVIIAFWFYVKLYFLAFTAF